MVMVLSKVTKEQLLARKLETMKDSIKHLTNTFKVSKSIIDSNHNFYGFKTRQDDDGTITMDMEQYVQSTEYLDISRTRRNQANAAATEMEFDSYRFLAGSIICTRNGTLP